MAHETSRRFLPELMLVGTVSNSRYPGFRSIIEDVYDGDTLEPIQIEHLHSPRFKNRKIEIDNTVSPPTIIVQCAKAYLSNVTWKTMKRFKSVEDAVNFVREGK